jgi:serine/threonine protein kinase
MIEWAMDGSNHVDARESDYPLTARNNNKTHLSAFNTTTNAASDGADASKNFKVEVSQQQKQEVYSILAMLHGGTASNSCQTGNYKDTTSLTKISKRKCRNDDVAEFEGEYNSGDDDGQVLPAADNDLSGGNNKRGRGAFVHKKSLNDVETINARVNPKIFSSMGSQSQSSINGNDELVLSQESKSSSSFASRYYYGKPKLVQSIGRFTEIGSVLGPFFCLGQLGKGTFSSIHKCINLNYFHHLNKHNVNVDGTQSSNRRFAAAKVELVDFQKSGVLEAEATILDFLHKALPPFTVPVYMGHYKADEFAAIFMEYLPGEDMHQLREHVMARTTSDFNESLDDGTNVTTNISPPTRRINVNDAVYLTADVMLPLLQRMHEVGVVHRDVKPSNCVRSSTGPKSKQFCMVDFGLSKSIIVPQDSDFADKEHVWDQKHWLKPYTYQNTEFSISGCYRTERKKAEFRGTSMYASLRVHQCKDYCPRDDIWSLLYVFCDLVSGGLPWMQYAASRERDACQRHKERVHGENESGECSEPEIAELLKGDIYHKAFYQREKSLEAGIAEDRLPPLPTPLAMCEETSKIQSLAKAFAHVGKLEFWEKPDYKLIQDCIKVFNKESNSKDPIIRPIDWDTNEYNQDEMNVPRKRQSHNEWQFIGETDPIDKLEDDVFDVPDELVDGQRNQDTFTNRIPLEFRFKITQMDYNLSALQSWRSKQLEISTHRAMADWMLVVVELLYKEWDTKRYEDGGHRTSKDGFRRDCYLQLLEKCRKYAKQCDDFGKRDLMYSDPETSDSRHGDGKFKNDCETEVHRKPSKRRTARLSSVIPGSVVDDSNYLLLVSRAIFGLDAVIKSEQSKKSAPPVPISFG